MRRSSPIIISSISLQLPSLTSLGLSKVDTISPPSTSARRSMPSKSACSMAITPAGMWVIVPLPDLQDLPKK